jgi:ABC-type sulfate transport system substrate-binding protein
MLAANVWRYVQLAQSRGGTCFCTRGAMQGYDVDLFILALAKTVTPVGVPGGSRGGPYRRPLISLL